MAVAIPYATRSNESLKMKQECLSMADAVKYVIDLAAESKKPTRIIIDPANNIYWLETATSISDRDYMRLEDFGGDERSLGRSVKIMDVEGFETEGRRHSLTFEPTRPWPSASISLTSGDEVRTIKINGKQVEIEEPDI